MTAGAIPTTDAVLPRERKLRVLGVEITDMTSDDAVDLLEDLVTRTDGRTRTVYYVNAHTLNLAVEDASFREVLAASDYVFGDGTGVRWAARVNGVRLRANLNGTDLTPALFARGAGRGLRYFLLGATPEQIAIAAETAKRLFPGWEQAGFHHGYVHEGDASARVVEQINAARPNLLLVGMGNPLQEKWIDAHKSALRVPLCAGVGGLFTYWSGDLDRAPAWMRRLGVEWLHILRRQPAKAKRYVVGNPLFVWRMLKLREPVAP